MHVPGFQQIKRHCNNAYEAITNRINSLWNKIKIKLGISSSPREMRDVGPLKSTNPFEWNPTVQVTGQDVRKQTFYEYPYIDYIATHPGTFKGLNYIIEAGVQKFQELGLTDAIYLSPLSNQADALKSIYSTVGF